MDQKRIKSTSKYLKSKIQSTISIPVWIVIISLFLVISLVMLSGILGTSNNPCTRAGCHGSERWEYNNLLPFDSQSSLPTEFQVNSDQDVKIAVEVTGSGSDSYYLINVLKVTLSSSNNIVYIPNAQQEKNNLYPGNKVLFQWSVQGIYSGDDTLSFSLWASNPHESTTFTDSYQYDIIVQDRPTMPRNVKATAGNEFVELAWQAPVSDGGVSITGYNIHRGTSSGVKPKTQIDSVGTAMLKYNDTSVTNGQTYYYYIVAKNAIGESDPSDEVGATPELKATVPSPPQNLLATPGNGFVDLSWDAPANNGGLGIAGYLIYSGTKSGSETEVDTVTISYTTYRDNSVVNGVKYYYYITAENLIGESDHSNRVSAEPDGTPPSVAITSPRNNSYLNSNNVDLGWTSNDQGMGLDYYEIRLDNGNWEKLTNITTHSYSSLSEGKHTVYLKAYDKLGNINLTWVVFTVDLHPPVIKIISPANNSLINFSSITLNWNTTDKTSGVACHEIKLEYNPWVKITNGETYKTQPLEDGEYTIYLRGVDRAGNIASRTLEIEVDITPPKVISSSYERKINEKFVYKVSFSEPMNKSSIELVFTGGDGTISWKDNTLTFTSENKLEYETMYEITVFGTDIAGNKLLGNMNGFTTKAQEKIIGKIFDKNGKSIPEVEIILAGGAKTYTDEDGYFSILTQQGTYTLIMTKQNYQTLRWDVSIEEGEQEDLGEIQMQKEEKEGREIYNNSWVLFALAIIIVVIVLLVIIGLIVNKKKPRI